MGAAKVQSVWLERTRNPEGTEERPVLLKPGERGGQRDKVELKKWPGDSLGRALKAA